MRIPIVKCVDQDHIKDYILITKNDFDTTDIHIPDASIRIYHFHPITHEYCGQSLAYVFGNKVLCNDTANVTLIPTSDAAPYSYHWDDNTKYGVKRSELHYTQVFNLETQTWEYQEDHRNFKYKYNEDTKTFEKIDWDEYNKKARFYSDQYHYLKYYLPLEGDTPDSSPRIADFIGPLPDDAVINELPSEKTLKEQILKHMYTAFDQYMFRLFRNVMDISDKEIELLHPDYTNQIVNTLITYEHDNVGSITRQEIQNSSENAYLSAVRYSHLYPIFIAAMQQVMNYDTSELYIQRNVVSPLAVIGAIHGIENREKVVNVMNDYSNRYHVAHLVFAVARKKLRLDNHDFSYKELYINKDTEFDFEYIVALYMKNKEVKLSK